MTRVAVVGGGIAGLTAAFELHERGIDTTLFEAAKRLGGKLQTVREDGFLIDAGPDSFLSTKPAALALVERLGLSGRLINTLPDGGGTFILRAGRPLPLPEGLTLLVPADFGAIARTPLLSPLGKLRMVLDVVIPPRRDEADESVGAFVRRRVGREAFERMAEPLLSGIYAGDADRLSLQATFPRLRQSELEHGSVIKGAIAQRRQAAQAEPRPGAQRTPFVTLQGGLGELVDALAERLDPASVRLGAEVRGIEETGEGVRVSAAGASETFDGVVLAVPAAIAAELLGAIDGALSEQLRQIPYVSSATVSLAFRETELGHRPAGRGFVIPRAEERRLTAVTWTSNKFAGRAPEGIALLRGFVGRAGDEAVAALPDDEPIALVRAELRAILGIQAAPLLARVFRWPAALPQYNLGHPERLAAIDRLLAAHPRLALTGGAYRGVGIPDCIADATRQSAALLERIEASAYSPATSA